MLKLDFQKLQHLKLEHQSLLPYHILTDDICLTQTGISYIIIIKTRRLRLELSTIDSLGRTTPGGLVSYNINYIIKISS